MHVSAVLLAALASNAAAHGVITMVMGANGVNMPGLSVMDGVPRDCATPTCGAEKDTSIIRTAEMGTNKATALGRTNGFGPVNGAAAIAQFMGNSTAAAAAKPKRGLLGNLLGGGAAKGGAAAGGAAAGGAAAGGATTSAGTKTPKGTTENAVAASAGKGATMGLPTTDANGTINMMFHQVNQDGAGPLMADIDATSGGQDPTAFKQATVQMDVPGIGIGGLSAATTTDFPVSVMMPAGMTCSGSVGGASNVCVVRVMNQALAGPFGGSGAFTQSPQAAKRAVEYNLRKRHFARGTLGAADEE